MAYYKYLIIGGGMAGDSAIQGIREIDPGGTIGLIGDEPHAPYNRPPLSKALWKGKPLDSVWRATDRADVAMHLGRRVRVLDARAKTVTDDWGNEHAWETLLLATGGSPRTLPLGSDEIIYFRTLDDYHRLRGLAGRGRRFAVIGGGFIGAEIAAALSMNQKNVLMFVSGVGICGRMLPPDLAQFLNQCYREKGVDVRTGETVVSVKQETHGSAIVTTKSGTTVAVDGVVAGLGIAPNVELARDAGLLVDNGITVNARLQTTHPAIYSAGDVAAWYSSALGKRVRVEHEDNANAMGKAAGRAMAGVQDPYRHVSFFYSDLFDMGYEAVGNLDPRLEIVSDWKDPFREGVVYYLGDGRVQAVLLWNTWGQVDAAQKLIEELGPFRPEDLKGRLPAAA